MRRGERPASAAAYLLPLLSLAMVVWGGTWPAGKIASTEAPPEVTILWRFLFTALGFVPILLVMQRADAAPRGGAGAGGAAGAHVPRFSTMPLRAWVYTVATAAGMVAYNQLFLYGVRRGLAGVGGIITPTVGALITGSVTLILQRRRPGRLTLIGLALGLAGGLAILRIWRFSAAELLRSGNLFYLAAAATWSTVTFCSQRAQESSHFATHTFAAYALGAVLALPFALSSGSLLPPDPGPSFWLLVLFLGVVATDFATTIFFISASRLGTGRTSSFLFIVPTSAILLSWLALGERPDAVTLVGGALSIAAVYLVNVPQRSP